MILLFRNHLRSEILVRQIGKFRLQIWQIMSFGALIVLVTGQISIKEALESINIDVILFLFGMFVVGQALEDSGYLTNLSYRIFKKARSVSSLIFLILFVIGLLSAFLMNDTLAIIGTPVVLLLARKHKISSKVLLLTLCFSVTIGSVISPIGNPQNLLIAVNGNVENPFVTFLRLLLIPTVINLLAAYLLLGYFYREEFHNNVLDHSQEPIKDSRLAAISRISLCVIIILILFKISLVFLAVKYNFRLIYIALFAALPIILFSKRRFKIVKNIDWSTLIFFVAMFILMKSVWNTGFFQNLIFRFDIDITSIIIILLISVMLSQLISNVPLVALYLPMLINSGASTKEMTALAAGTTMAGNLFILGAASNVIIIQNAEKRSGETISFLEFAKIGIPLTIINIFVYWLFLSFL